MIGDRSLGDLLLHPLSVLSGAFALLGGWLKLPILGALWGALVANVGALFAAAGVASQFPRLVPLVSAGELQLLAFLLGGLFVLTRLDRFLDDVAARLNGDDGDDTS
jgi:hypothetical protein